MPRFDAEDIRRYYDRHTPAFLSRGQGRGTGSIHRAVWGPGVTTRREAFHYVHDRIADLARSVSGTSGAAHLLDLGCGVGASLCYLATQLEIRGTGVTLSPVQRTIAEARIHDDGLSDRLRCIDGDFNALPPDVEAIDLAYAIESFVHGASPHRFFAECQRVVRPGGLLVICDDFMRAASSHESRRALDRFREGWHINTLISRDGLVELGQAAGFELDSATDLTPWLELYRARDRFLAMPANVFDWACRSLQPLLRLDPPLIDCANRRFGHLLGGHALQTCLARGWVGYDLVVFRRR
ncbi:MAG: class I SAM-dependent methyltransferase [Acidobacteria bacterium]|nr:class I SAM-dependent methyltransferase [Acidobacteriota bacterium]